MTRIDPIREKGITADVATWACIRKINEIISALDAHNAQEPEHPRILPTSDELFKAWVGNGNLDEIVAKVQVTVIEAVISYLQNKCSDHLSMYTICEKLRADAEARFREAKG